MVLTHRSLPKTIDLEAIETLFQCYPIRKLALFGSVLRDDFCPDSDIDILVEFEPGHTPGFSFIEIQ
jgi:predicted nucleotidyltransferase